MTQNEKNDYNYEYKREIVSDSYIDIDDKIDNEIDNEENKYIENAENEFNNETNNKNIKNDFNINNINNINDEYLVKYKQKLNMEFTDYVLKNLNHMYLYNEYKKKIRFNLQKLGNIQIIYNNLQNSKKKISKKLEYNIHKRKMLTILDNFTLLMINKGYIYDFDRFEYIMYELKKFDNFRLKDKTDNNINIDEIYFIKMKLKNQTQTNITNIINDNKYENTIKYKTLTMFILHDDKLFYYL